MPEINIKDEKRSLSFQYLYSFQWSISKFYRNFVLDAIFLPAISLHIYITLCITILLMLMIPKMLFYFPTMSTFSTFMCQFPEATKSGLLRHTLNLIQIC